MRLHLFSISWGDYLSPPLLKPPLLRLQGGNRAGGEGQAAAGPSESGIWEHRDLGTGATVQVCRQVVCAGRSQGASQAKSYTWRVTEAGALCSMHKMKSAPFPCWEHTKPLRILLEMEQATGETGVLCCFVLPLALVFILTTHTPPPWTSLAPVPSLDLSTLLARFIRTTCTDAGCPHTFSRCNLTTTRVRDP